MRIALLIIALAFLITGKFVAQEPQATAAPEPPRTFGFSSYPPIAVAARIEGAVLVRLHIDERGQVATSASLAGPPALRATASDNARTWTFPEGRKRDIILTYLFEIDGYCVAPAPTLLTIRPPYDVVRVTTCQNWTQ